MSSNTSDQDMDDSIEQLRRVSIDEYSLLIDQLQHNYDQMVSVGRSLDGKLTVLFSGSALFISLTTAAGMSLPDLISLQGWQLVLTSIALLAFLAMVVVTLLAWSPSQYEVSIKTSKGEGHMVETYLMRPHPADSYSQVVSNLFHACESARKRIERKAKAIVVSAILLGIQIIAIVIVALTL